MTFVTLTVLCLVNLSGNSLRAQQLRDKIEPSQIVPYSVTITAETPTSLDTLSGAIAFTGKQSEGQTITLAYTGGLS